MSAEYHATPVNIHFPMCKIFYSNNNNRDSFRVNANSIVFFCFFSSNMNGNSVAEKRNQDFWIKHFENMIIRNRKTNLTEHLLLAHKTINSCGILTVFYGTKKLNLSTKYGTKYSRMDQVKFVQDRRSDHFKFFKGCLPQILLVLFLNNLTHIWQFKKNWTGRGKDRTDWFRTNHEIKNWLS